MLGWSLGSLVLLAAPAAAQRPGDELPSAERVRQQYIASAYVEVKEMVDRWREAVLAGDQRGLPRLLTEDALYAPALTESPILGRESVRDSLLARKPSMRGYRLSLTDFTASGALAYGLGRFGYDFDDRGTMRAFDGTFVMVFALEGRHWRIRSYLERNEP